MKKILVVENINAGKKNAVSADKIIEEFYLGKDVELNIVGIEDISEDAVKNSDVIITVGGDRSEERR